MFRNQSAMGKVNTSNLLRILYFNYYCICTVIGHQCVLRNSSPINLSMVGQQVTVIPCNSVKAMVRLWHIHCRKYIQWIVEVLLKFFCIIFAWSILTVIHLLSNVLLHVPCNTQSIIYTALWFRLTKKLVHHIDFLLASLTLGNLQYKMFLNTYKTFNYFS